MIRLSPEAEAQVDALLSHYERLERPEAAYNLFDTITEASSRIEEAPESGLPAPRPYPTLSSLGLRWIKQRSYWIGYSTGVPPIVAAVFYETANIPGRISQKC